MKKIILMSILCMVSLAGFCPPKISLVLVNSAPIKPLEALWEAQGTVESHKDASALNRTEMAYGYVQIRAIRLLDYNQRTGNSYTLKDCYDITISKQIWLYYAHQFSPNDYEGIARAWNCNSLEYWIKVKSELKKQNYDTIIQ